MPDDDVVREDIVFDGSSVTFGTGTRTKDGSRRTPFKKVCLLGGALTKALIDHVFAQRHMMTDTAYYSDRFRRFDALMNEYGITHVVESLATHLTPGSFRSLGASMMEHILDIRSVHANPTTGAFAAVRLQLGHAEGSTATTQGYMANVIENGIGDDEIAVFGGGAFVKTVRVGIARGELCVLPAKRGIDDISPA